MLETGGHPRFRTREAKTRASDRVVLAPNNSANNCLSRETKSTNERKYLTLLYSAHAPANEDYYRVTNTKGCDILMIPNSTLCHNSSILERLPVCTLRSSRGEFKEEWSASYTESDSGCDPSL